MTNEERMGQERKFGSTLPGVMEVKSGVIRRGTDRLHVKSEAISNQGARGRLGASGAISGGKQFDFQASRQRVRRMSFLPSPGEGEKIVRMVLERLTASRYIERKAGSMTRV